MTQSNDLTRRVEQLENGQIDLRMAVSSLLEIVERHQVYHETTQRNFERIFNEIQSIRADMQEMRADMQEMQSEIRGLQTENRRILDILQHWDNEQGD